MAAQGPRCPVTLIAPLSAAEAAIILLDGSVLVAGESSSERTLRVESKVVMAKLLS